MRPLSLSAIAQLMNRSAGAGLQMADLRNADLGVGFVLSFEDLTFDAAAIKLQAPPLPIGTSCARGARLVCAPHTLVLGVARSAAAKRRQEPDRQQQGRHQRQTGRLSDQAARIGRCTRPAACAPSAADAVSRQAYFPRPLLDIVEVVNARGYIELGASCKCALAPAASGERAAARCGLSS